MRDELLQAVIAAPDDDRPRLVYADWLQERADPLGEFIQLQCRIAREEGDESSLRRMKLRAAKLKKAHGEEWERRLLGLVPPPARWEWRRGFVEHIEAQARVVSQWGPRLLAVAPLARSLAGGFVTDDVTAFLDCPLAPRLVALQAYLGDEGLPARLFGPPALSALRTLNLRSYVTDVDVMDALVDSPALARLEHLELTPCPTDMTPLARATWPLAELVLDGGHHEGNLGAALAGLRLRRLVIRGMPLFAEWMSALLDGGTLEHVVDLELSHGGLGPEVLDALLDERRLPALRRLHVGGNVSLGDDGARRIAAHPGARRLTKLHIGGSRVRSQGARALAASPYLGGLEWLILSDTKIDDEAQKALAGSTTLGGRVWLRGKILTPSGS